MYQLSHVADHRRLLNILSRFEESAAGLQLLLFIGNGDYSDLLAEGSISVSEDKPTIVADVTVATRVRKDLENAPAVLKADIDGIQVPLLTGFLSALEVQEDFSTKLIINSFGALLGRVRMVPSDGARNITEYASLTPERVIRDAVFRCAGVGGYDAGAIYIQRQGVPLLSYLEQEGFEDTAKCWDVLDKAAKQLGLLYRDTPDGGFEALRSPNTSVEEPIAWNYETPSLEILKWVPPAIKSPDEQYSDVLVRKREDSGSYSVIGSAKVDYFRTNYAPHANQTLVIDYTDALDGQAAARARRMAYDRARLLSQGVYKAQIAASFNPLLQKGDVVQFLEDYVDERGQWRRHWQGIIKTYKHPFKEGIETDLELECFITKEELLSPPSTAGKKPGASSVGVTVSRYGPLYPRKKLYPSRTLYPRSS